MHKECALEELYCAVTGCRVLSADPGVHMSILGILLLSHSQESLREAMHSKRESSEDFIHFANSALEIIISYIQKNYYNYTQLGSLYTKCGNIISVLGRDCILEYSRLLLIMSYGRQFALNLRSVILHEIRRRLPEEQGRYLYNVADRCLAESLWWPSLEECRNIRGLLMIHQDLISDRTCARLLQASSWVHWTDLLFPEVIIKLSRYASEHLHDYLYAIIYQMTDIDQHVLRVLLSLTTPLSGHIRVEKDTTVAFQRTLILGIRRFPRIKDSEFRLETPELESLKELCSTITLYEERTSKVPSCRTCGEPLTPSIFTRQCDSFGVYLCNRCAATAALPVQCPVCLSEGEQKRKMSILRCGHACCVECLVRITSCPIYRIKIEGEMKVPAIDAVAKFLRETS